MSDEAGPVRTQYGGTQQYRLYLVHLIDEQTDMKHEDYSDKMGSGTIGTLGVRV